MITSVRGGPWPGPAALIPTGGWRSSLGAPAALGDQGFLASGAWVRTEAADEALSVEGEGQAPGAQRRQAARYLDPDLPCAPIPGPGSSQG